MAPAHPQSASAGAGEGEAAFGDAQGGGAGDLAEREGEVWRGHHLAGALEHRAVGIEALGVLAHGDEVDRMAATRGEAGAGFGRADVGVEIQADAQLAGGVEAAFGRLGIVVVRDRAEDHAIGGVGGVEHVLREGGAVGREGLEADRGGGEND